MDNKKIIAIALLIITFSMIFASTAMASISVNVTANQNELTTDAQTIGQNIVNVVQGVFTVAAILFVIWAGITFFGAHGDPQKIQMAKKMLGGFVISMILIFYSDHIVATLLGVFQH